MSEGLGLGLPGALTLGVGGEFWRAQMVGLEGVDLPSVSADLGLPEGGRAVGGVGLPAIGTGKLALGVEFGDQSFVGVEVVGSVAVDGFGDAPSEGVVAVGGAFLAVLGDLTEPVGGVGVGVVGGCVRVSWPVGWYSPVIASEQPAFASFGYSSLLQGCKIVKQ